MCAGIAREMLNTDAYFTAYFQEKIAGKRYIPAISAQDWIASRIAVDDKPAQIRTNWKIQKINQLPATPSN